LDGDETIMKTTTTLAAIALALATTAANAAVDERNMTCRGLLSGGPDLFKIGV
jgi:hypothetical protein